MLCTYGKAKGAWIKIGAVKEKYEHLEKKHKM